MSLVDLKGLDQIVLMGGVGARGVDRWYSGGGGNAKEKESPDFRFPEVGISELVQSVSTNFVPNIIIVVSFCYFADWKKSSKLQISKLHTPMLSGSSSNRLLDK